MYTFLICGYGSKFATPNDWTVNWEWTIKKKIICIKKNLNVIIKKKLIQFLLVGKEEIYTINFFWLFQTNNFFLMTTRPGHPLEIGSGKGIVTRWGNRMVQLAAPGRSNVFKNQAKEVLAKFFVTCALHLGMMPAFCFNDLPKAKYITSELRSNTLSNPPLGYGCILA